MARPRAAQFAKDIGVSTNEAKKLINEGRQRKDGGSVILENAMDKTMDKKKVVKAKSGKSVCATSTAKTGNGVTQARGMGAAIQGGDFRGVK